MSTSPDTRMHIILSAIQVLKSLGMEGLTMRKVAAEADISLGNLQYHYKNKIALIAGLADHYFGECEKLLDEYVHQPEGGSAEQQLTSLILFHLDHMDEISDMCRIFREMWALSTRDQALHDQLMNYYKVYQRKLADLLVPVSGDKKSAKGMASLLMPYIEGYSITVYAMPQSKRSIANMLTRACMSLQQ